MGTARRTVTHNSVTFPTGGAAALVSSNITDLNTKFSPGNQIVSGDINKLRSMLNNALAHYHNYTDRYSSKTFGNTGHAGNLEESKNTGLPNSKPADVSTVSIGEAIQATRFNQYANVARYIHSHSHTINDRTA